MNSGELLIHKINLKAYEYAIKWLEYEMAELSPFSGDDERLDEIKNEKQVIKMLLNLERSLVDE
ncbi:hypothetical protein [Peptostreptococcus anaerobius]|uniref:Uncharacterized protein n=1 Tax=Peptostreptococcus anaerobius TaxID=1261 RepID=A0A135YYZ8_9FIRM|nr:hypothetical protein [Peptostreptococcus anaerobius]KXI14634.1 hypothetical protein HMPREF3195_00155 [Peptostreptococcus anaerobius]